MPRVPTYDGQQLVEQAITPVMARTPDVSSGLEAIGNGLDDASDAAFRIHAHDQEVKAEQAEAQMTADWLRWDGESRAKYVGERAVEYGAAAQTWWKDNAGAYGKDLSAYGKRIIAQRMRQKSSSAIGAAAAWAATEKVRHADDVAESNLKNTAEFAVRTGSVGAGRQQIREQVASYGARKGWVTEQVESKTREVLTTMHAAHISATVEADATAAQQYLTAHTDEIDADTRDRLQAVIDREGESQFATSFALGVSELPYEDQVRKARQIKNPDRQAAALSQVDAQYARARRIQADAERSAGEEAYRMALAGEVVPSSVYERMDPLAAMRLQRSIDRSSKPGSPKTDISVYRELEDMAEPDLARISNEEFAAIYAPHLSAEDAKYFTKRISAYNKGGGDRDSMVSDDQRVNDALFSLGIYPESKTPEKRLEAAKFRSLVDSEQSARESALGRKMRPDEKRDMLAEMVENKAWHARLGSDVEMPVKMMTDDQLANAYYRVDVGGKTVEVQHSAINDDFRADARMVSELTGKDTPMQADVARLFAEAQAQQGIESPRSIVPEKELQQILATLRRKNAMAVDASGREDHAAMRKHILRMYLAKLAKGQQ